MFAKVGRSWNRYQSEMNCIIDEYIKICSVEVPSKLRRCIGILQSLLIEARNCYRYLDSGIRFMRIVRSLSSLF